MPSDERALKKWDSPRKTVKTVGSRTNAIGEPSCDKAISCVMGRGP